ncbi:MAG: STAS/SEC14 domain-containing protein [Bacteroidota bacterium]
MSFFLGLMLFCFYLVPIMVETNIIRTKVNDIWIDDEGFLILKPKEGVELDLDEVKACFEAYRTLGIGPHNKVLELIDARDGSMNSEARTYAAEHGKDYFIAAAIVSDSLAVRLVVNFFNTFYKQIVPFKMFATEESARKWLRTFREA